MVRTAMLLSILFWSIPVLVFFLPGCDREEEERSEVKTERAKVVSLIYEPTKQELETELETDIETHIGLDGNLHSMPVTRPVTRTVTIPERHGVIFKCEHGKFVVLRRSIWERFEPGDQVIVKYREVHTVTKNSDGKVLLREFKKFSFVDAELAPPDGQVEAKP